ncbi:MAG: hypothetical protein IJ485_02570 [Lachnospiraceae bacterium]|nr:hypothetical protein [Lachnospiraceae bacterium]
MGSAWEFPTSLNIGGVDYEIRTDYRAVLDLLTALNDEELTDADPQIEAYMKSRVILEIMFPQCDDIPAEHIQEALDKVAEFIDMGITEDSKKPKTMDWEQDAPILIPAINKVLNREIRSEKYMHWWTFLGAYMEIGESLFSNIIHIRQKKAKGKKLEKWELDFYKENKSLIDFKQKNQRSEAEKEELRDYFGYKKK